MNPTVVRLLRTGGPLVGLLATWCLFAAAAGAPFVAWHNQELMLLQTAVVGTAAVGATWIVVSGGVDLSVGASVALGTMVGAMVLRGGGSWPLAALATVASVAAIGGVLGALVVGMLVRVVLAGAAAAAVAMPLTASPGLAIAGATAVFVVVLLMTRRLGRGQPLSPFIVTLGLWGALRGLAKGLGGNQPVYFPANDPLSSLMQPGSLLLPIGVWVMLAVAALGAIGLRATVFGRRVVALGSNRETARLCGVDVVRAEVLVYVLGGACAGIAAVLQLSFLSMGDPTTAQGLELKVIAAAVIGGASLRGGEGSIVGTLLGALIMTVVDNGCTKLGLANWTQEVATGAIIVGAVALDRWRQQRG